MKTWRKKMSEMYSSSSGSYSNYLAQRQTDEIKKTIEKESNQQKFMYALGTGATIYSINQVGDKVDAVNASIQRMSTGIQTSLNQNTYAIAASSLLLSETFNKGFDTINNTLDLGFAGVQNSLGSMSASMTAGFDRLQKSMDYWGNEICEKLDAIHDIVNNPLLTASRELFRRATSNASKQFYEEALEDIKGAVEKNKTDYISWGLMGKIYLFGVSEFSNVVDVPKALEAFTNACKYISPDVDESDEAKKMAAEFYFYAGYANYILSNESRLENKTDDVTKYLQASATANAKSFALSDTMLEAAYNQARALVLSEQKDKAFLILEKIIRIDGLYSIKALGDADFKNVESNIVEIIKKLRDECQSKAKDFINDFQNNYVLIGGHYCEQIKGLIEKCEELINSDSPYLDVRTVYEAFHNEFENIKNNKHPMDLLVYENKFVKNNSDNTIIKDEAYCYEAELETELTSPVWDANDITIKRCKKTITFDNEIRLLKEIFNNQVVLRHSSVRALTVDGAVLDYEEIPIYLQNNRFKTVYAPCVSYAFIQEKYGDPGKIVLKDNAFISEYKYDSKFGSKEVKIQADDIYNFTNNYKWKIDENTSIILECLKEEVKYGGQYPKRLVVFQHGIVSKQYLGEWKNRINSKKEEEKSVQEEDEYISVIITNFEIRVNSFFEVIAKIKEDEKKEVRFKFEKAGNNENLYWETASEINGKKVEPIITKNVAKEIRVKKTDFFRYKDWNNRDYTRIYASKNDFLNDCEHYDLYQVITIQQGLSLGVLKENVELRKQRKTKKSIITFAVIAIILVIIGVFVFR